MQVKIVLFFMLFFLCSCIGEKMETIYSPDKKNYLSRFEYCDNEGRCCTIFSYGKPNKKKLPLYYIKAKDNWRDAWYVLIKWNENEAFFYFTYADFEGVDLDHSPLHLVKMPEEKLFSSYFFDKIPNDYIKVSSIPEYNTKQK